MCIRDSPKPQTPNPKPLKENPYWIIKYVEVLRLILKF
jgi:hypothetical protein